MKSSDVRAKYLAFFQGKSHAIIPAAPIVPLEDVTTLFTSSGMQQLVPYLKGEIHPKGTRLTDSQPSFRTDDIEEIGDNRHICMFEMLGNWSLGDYFKSEQLPWIFEFLTQEVGLNKDKLFVTVFEGDEYAPRDEEAISIWQNIFNNHSPAQKGVEGFQKNTKIYMYPAKKNWWSRGGVPENMPVGEIGGPDSEIFYDFGEDLHLHENSPWKDEPCHVNCDCGRFLEIGNSVFMQYEKVAGGVKPLPKKNVDFGGGLERIVAASNDNPDIFMTDMFENIIKSIEQSSGKSYKDNAPAMRVIADHLRAATFMMGEGIEPSNKMQGYILRRLLRRAAVKSKALGADTELIFKNSIPQILKEYSSAGFIKSGQDEHIIEVATIELTKFGRALDKGLRELEKAKLEEINETFAFNLFQSYGFPFEITQELALQKGIKLEKSNFDQVFSSHKEGSRTASVGMFKGGLADHSEITTKLHTATHLLQASMRQVLGSEVSQAGSNITPERLRFDYTFSGKPTPEELAKIEAIINQKIKEDLPVTRRIENKAEAIKSGAMAFFADKYPDEVSVYIVGNVDKDWFSKELCGGPHVESTGKIGQVKIFKEESLGSGKRRIYARLA